MFASGDASFDQIGALEDANVFRHRVERHIEGIGEFRDTRLAMRESLKDLPARGIRQSH